MKNSYNSIPQFLVDTKVLINNSVNDPMVKAAVALYGFDDEELGKAQNLLNTVEDLHNVKEKEYGDQYQAFDKYKEAREKANNEYNILLTIARITFKNDVGAYQSLDLSLNRKRSYSGWLSQAIQFCNNLIAKPDYITAMEKFGQGLDKIEAVKKLITETQSYLEAHRSEKGEAQQATKNRDEKLDELYNWADDYKKIARIALKDQPQLLEKLGLLERS